MLVQKLAKKYNVTGHTYTKRVNSIIVDIDCHDLSPF